ncbi:MAG: type II toxin-antitoxin system VapC family toxin [Burkholderiaceae bacterium]
MRILLDTHVFLWAVASDRRLGASAREKIAQADAVFVSAASLWEIAIKSRLGKIDGDLGELLAAVEASGFQELPVRGSHAAVVATLPMIHGDPFDRLLVAQAMTEPLRLLTADVLLTGYTDLVMLVT